ncbi:hypothetical protein RRSWK_03341 [Rhodopirellula sp. SWK7]|nr:hypothetical protein RRSWK_03341 [Rhodopirellula sp. SWK7]
MSKDISDEALSYQKGDLGESGKRAKTRIVAAVDVRPRPCGE